MRKFTKVRSLTGQRSLAGFLCVAVCLGGLTFGAIGCSSSQKSTVSSPGYWKRVFRKWGNDFHEFRVDWDRIVWDLEERPLEDY